MKKSKMTFLDSKSLLSCNRLFSIYFIRTKFLCIRSRSFHMEQKCEAKSNMEIVNIPPIVSTFRQALHTFNDEKKPDFKSNFEKLKLLMNTLKAEDFCFDKLLNDPATWKNSNKAPCTYIEIFQNNIVNMSIFVLKPGFKMPLHDHPHMHGLLKVISGSVNIRSFTEFPLKEAANVTDFAVRAKLEAAKRAAKGVHKKRRFFAKVTTDRTFNANSETCILTPKDSNFHEIEALQLPAAFFDILAPPYDAYLKDVGPRKCSYFEIVNSISTNLVELQETGAPECFYCDQAPYLGPLLA